MEAGLLGTFKTWLSTDLVSPATRFAAVGQYHRVDGALVAASWLELTDGDLDASISLTATGDFFRGPVWTGTQVNGFQAPSTCGSWLEPGASATWGFSDRLDAGWTRIDDRQRCAGNLAIYCFEQGPNDPCAVDIAAMAKAAKAACFLAQLPAVVCDNLPADACGSCDAVLEACKAATPDSDLCPSSWALCKQCVHAFATCTEDAICGLADFLCTL